MSEDGNTQYSDDTERNRVLEWLSETFDGGWKCYIWEHDRPLLVDIVGGVALMNTDSAGGRRNHDRQH